MSMSGAGQGVEYYSLIRDGASLLFTGTLIGLVLLILTSAVMGTVVNGMAYYSINDAVHAGALIAMVVELIVIAVTYKYAYGGFIKLATANRPRYDIGRVGSIAYIIGLVIMCLIYAYMLTITFSPGNLWLTQSMEMPGKIALFVTGIPVAIGEYRLGNEFGVESLTVGSVLGVILSAINLIPGSTVMTILEIIMALITWALLLMGFNNVRKIAEDRLKQQ